MWSEAAVRDGAEELTLRRGEDGGLRTFIDTTNGWRPPLVDEDWHAKPPARASRREKLYCRFVELGQAVSLRQPSTSRKAKTLWK